MAKKKDEEVVESEILKRIYDYTLEDIMGDRFSRYAKAIIQDRAIPDVRDGLKPVQRRILYGMYHDHNTHDKPTRKSAKTVGYIMGNYHPHGDSSIYDAMVRMSQWWKQSTPYIEMQGNNGSMDGDGAAAMRYTEVRLTKIAEELLKDIDKKTVSWAPNFDDTELEPTVLPAKFPNLLVNGANGISAGYATNIPPHNLVEVINATIKRIDSPNCHEDSILDIIKGPDFPTGGIVEGQEGLRDALTKGRGKIIVRSRTEIISDKKGDKIIITEIPFDVNKAALVKRISELVIDKKIEGISEVRDESDRHDPVRIVIDLKKEAKADLILNYLYKNSELQISYNYNMVAIVNRCPKTLGVIEVLDAYIAHQKECITKRTEFELNFAKDRLHIVEGLIKAISILDEVIATIRASKNKSDAKVNLMDKYGFTERQAEYIVMLQLYRLTNSDILALQNEYNSLLEQIKELQSILDDENKLKSVMKSELRQIRDEYGVERKTVISEDVLDTTINEEDMIIKEDVIVTVSEEGYVKRLSKRAYKDDEKIVTKENDHIVAMFDINTKDTILLFTKSGNFIYLPVHIIPACSFKDIGKHISNIISASNDQIISAIKVTDFNKDVDILVASSLGMIKRTKLSEFKLLRYNKPVCCMKLKDGDTLVDAFISKYNKLFISTDSGYGLVFNIDEVPVVGLKASGVRSMKLKDDSVVSINNFDQSIEYISVITDRGTGKRVRISEFNLGTRGNRGVQIIKEVKANPYKVIKVFAENKDTFIGIKSNEIKEFKLTELSIMDRLSTGNNISKTPIYASYIVRDKLEEEDDIIEIIDTPKSKPDLNKIDEQLSLIEIEEII